jgi:hypothetical protein
MIDVHYGKDYIMTTRESISYTKTRTNTVEGCDWFLCCFQTFHVSPFFNPNEHQNRRDNVINDSILTKNKQRERLKEKLTVLIRNNRRKQDNDKITTGYKFQSSLRCASTEVSDCF